MFFLICTANLDLYWNLDMESESVRNIKVPSKYVALLFRMQLWPVVHFFHSLLGGFAAALLLISHFNLLCLSLYCLTGKQAKAQPNCTIWTKVTYMSNLCCCCLAFNVLLPPSNTTAGPLFYNFRVKEIPALNMIASSDQKSDNPQYNMLVCWTDGTNNSSTKWLTFQVCIFFS